MTQARIGLVMIVKNESHVIERCLRSVIPHIQHWTIVDTGSTDGTQTKIREILKNIPGQLHERPWTGFPENRNEALALARPHSQYLFTLDADEYLITSTPDVFANLTGLAYNITMERGNYQYVRKCVFNTQEKWWYEGVLHEYPQCATKHADVLLEGAIVMSPPEGARSKNPNKYQEDVALMEKALEKEPDNVRYWYYLAQSYLDAQEPAKAFETYMKRAQMKGWAEETWHALYRAARLSDQLQHPIATVQHLYLQAYNLRPARAEPLLWLADYSIRQGCNAQALLFATHCAGMQRPPQDVLFVEHICYGWLAQDVFARALAANGRLAKAQAVIRAMLNSPHTPDSETTRLKQNLLTLEAAESKPKTSQ